MNWDVGNNRRIAKYLEKKCEEQTEKDWGFERDRERK